MNTKEASARTGVPSATIRYNEKKGLIPAIDHLHWKLDHFDDHMLATKEELRNLEKQREDEQE